MKFNTKQDVAIFSKSENCSNGFFGCSYPDVLSKNGKGPGHASIDIAKPNNRFSQNP